MGLFCLADSARAVAVPLHLARRGVGGPGHKHVLLCFCFFEERKKKQLSTACLCVTVIILSNTDKTHVDISRRALPPAIKNKKNARRRKT